MLALITLPLTSVLAQGTLCAPGSCGTIVPDLSNSCYTDMPLCQNAWGSCMWIVTRGKSRSPNCDSSPLPDVPAPCKAGQGGVYICPILNQPLQSQPPVQPVPAPQPPVQQVPTTQTPAQQVPAPQPPAQQVSTTEPPAQQVPSPQPGSDQGQSSICAPGSCGTIVPDLSNSCYTDLPLCQKPWGSCMWIVTRAKSQSPNCDSSPLPDVPAPCKAGQGGAYICPILNQPLQSQPPVQPVPAPQPPVQQVPTTQPPAQQVPAPQPSVQQLPPFQEVPAPQPPAQQVPAPQPPVQQSKGKSSKSKSSKGKSSKSKSSKGNSSKGKSSKSKSSKSKSSKSKSSKSKGKK
jgi:hypothetical protein